uniref:zinc finger protein 39-like n=1 Tax=Jaculus jaculus TaxID=51337 RepID=UPI001E1B5FBF|nr:zinc finger protein 39-like [Jaculus jaculus]
MELVSFEDIAVDFSWKDWQYLDNVQQTLYRDVMLENYNSLVCLGHCMSKPELIFKLEQGYAPCSVPESSAQRHPELKPQVSIYYTKPHEYKQFQQFVCHKLHPTHQNAQTCEKPYEGYGCEKYVFWKSQLTLHQRTHTVGKPYGCGDAFLKKTNFTIRADDMNMNGLLEADSVIFQMQDFLSLEMTDNFMSSETSDLHVKM